MGVIKILEMLHPNKLSLSKQSNVALLSTYVGWQTGILVTTNQ